MNLLAKKREVSWLLIASFVLLVWGCKEDLGIELPPDVQRTEVRVEEFVLPVTNVYLDSLRTDKLTFINTGTYSDPIIGTVECTGYAEFKYSSGFVPAENTWIRRSGKSDSLTNLQFESLILNLEVEEILSSQFSVNQNLTFWELQDSIFSEGIYLRNRTIPKGNEIGQGVISIANLNPIDFDKDTIVYSFSLSEAYGSYLIEELIDKKISARPLGIAITSVGSNSLISFDLTNDTTELILTMRGQLYDTLNGSFLRDTLVNSTLRFTSSNHFTGINRDRSASPFVGIQDKESRDIDPNYVYFSPMAGIYPKIELDQFVEFSEIEPILIVNRAILSIILDDDLEFGMPIDQIMYYLTQDDENKIKVNWPGILKFPDKFSVLMQSDASFNRQQQLPEFHFYDTLVKSEPVVVGYSGQPTLFWQYFHDNIRDDFDGIKLENRYISQQWIYGFSDLLIKNAEKLPTNRHRIKKDQVKLKIYYTRPRE